MILMICLLISYVEFVLVPLNARRGCGHWNARYEIQGIDGGHVGSKAEHGAINIGCVTAG